MQSFPSLSLETKVHPLAKFENPKLHAHETNTKHTPFSSSSLHSSSYQSPPMVCTRDVSTTLGKEIRDNHEKEEEDAVVRSQSQSQSRSRSQSQSQSQSSMELFPGRSKSLHNFVLPGVNWGTQKYLRCMKLNDSDLNNPNSYCKSPSPVSFCYSDCQNQKFGPNSPNPANGRVRLGEKRLETVVSRDAEMEESGLAAAAAAAAATAAEEETRPWNLRTRRGACKAATMTGGGQRTETALGATNGGKVREEERRKFSLSLSRKEIEEDFMIMVGHKPARRPKRRPRALQKQLDALFPGMWLREVTADAYKVPEANENFKR